MVIVFVEDDYLHEANGTSVSTHRFREELIKKGHTVRVVALGVSGKDMYGLKEHRVPVVSAVAKRNNMYFAKFDKKIVSEAFTGADLVHLIFPWQLERKCLNLARKMGIPVCGAFHCQPENITYNIGIKMVGIANRFIYYLFKVWLYKNIENIHCPSSFAAEELKKYHYHARLHVISNGISDVFKPAETEPSALPGGKEKQDGGIIRILMTGRLAEEKRQDLIINAVKYSKYRDTIQLYFVGRGPMYKSLYKLGAGLPRAPQFFEEFISQEALLSLIHKSHIYVHSSEVELESLSCLEAIACGKVPIIADSDKSAAPQFALDKQSLFKKGSYLDLRDKLDYWIEHPEERERMGMEYAQLGRSYGIHHSVVKLEKLFEKVIKDFRTQARIPEDTQIQ
jgi:glycosyltransferase involved in cell wall biosynthesis